MAKMGKAAPFRRKPESHYYGRGIFPFYISRAEIYFGTHL